MAYIEGLCENNEGLKIKKNHQGIAYKCLCFKRSKLELKVNGLVLKPSARRKQGEGQL